VRWAMHLVALTWSDSCERLRRHVDGGILGR
jgi:hypothetical protein